MKIASKQSAGGNGQQPKGVMDRELPHDRDAEIAVLGCILLHSDALADVREVLRAGHAEFWTERHGILYRFIDRLASDGKPIDDVVIRDALKRTGEFDRIGGYDFLAECINSVASHFRARQYATIVHEHYLRRQAIRSAARTMDLAFELAEVETIVEEAADNATKLSELALSRQREDGSLVDQIAASLEELRNPSERGQAISTGLYGLDSLIYGLEPGELVLIGARPSRGKTALGLTIAEQIAVVDGIPVLFLSLEMRPAQVATRMMLSRARVNGHAAKQANLTAGEWQRIENAANEIGAAPLFVHNRVRKIDDIVNLARIAQRDQGIRVVMVDYLGLVEVHRRFDRLDQVLAEITRSLKVRIAEDLGVSVVLMAQLNRKLDSEDRPPRMADFRDSGAIEQDADKIILPWQNPEKVTTEKGTRRLVQGPVELIVDKHRNGPTGTADVEWIPHFARFENPNVRSEQNEFSYRP